MPRKANKKCFYLPTLSHASRQNLTKSLCNVKKRVKLISCFKLEYRYRLSVSANIGPKISVIGISVNFHIGASLLNSNSVSNAKNSIHLTSVRECWKLLQRMRFSESKHVMQNKRQICVKMANFHPTLLRSHQVQGHLTLPVGLFSI